MANLRKIIDGKDPSFPEFYAQNAPLPQKKAPDDDNDDTKQADPKGMATHISKHMTDPLEETKEGFEGLTNAKLNYEMEKEKMRRQLLPVQSVIQHVNQLHQLQDQYGTTPVDPNQNQDPNMGYQEERQGVPPNMQQQPGMMQQSNPNRNSSYPGAGPKIPTPPMGAQPGQPQSKGTAPKPPGGKPSPGGKSGSSNAAKKPGKGIEVHVKAATMAAPGASNTLANAIGAEKVRQMSSKCQMDAEGNRMAHVSMPTAGRSVSTPAGSRAPAMGMRGRLSAKKKKMEAKAPKGWEGTVKHMKKHSEIDNPYALSNYMKDKGYTPHHD